MVQYISSIPVIGEPQDGRFTWCNIATQPLLLRRRKIVHLHGTIYLFSPCCWHHRDRTFTWYHILIQPVLLRRRINRTFTWYNIVVQTMLLACHRDSAFTCTTYYSTTCVVAAAQGWCIYMVQLNIIIQPLLLRRQRDRTFTWYNIVICSTSVALIWRCNRIFTWYNIVIQLLLLRHSKDRTFTVTYSTLVADALQSYIYMVQYIYSTPIANTPQGSYIYIRYNIIIIQPLLLRRCRDRTFT